MSPHSSLVAGAMRVAPVALFCYNSTEALIETARQTARITHAHREGYNGAILQVTEREGYIGTILQVTES